MWGGSCCAPWKVVPVITIGDRSCLRCYAPPKIDSTALHSRARAALAGRGCGALLHALNEGCNGLPWVEHPGAGLAVDCIGNAWRCAHAKLPFTKKEGPMKSMLLMLGVLLLIVVGLALSLIHI